MLKKFLEGIVFGSGFTLAFIVLWIVTIYVIIPRVLDGHIGSGLIHSNEKVVSKVPHIDESERFLGSPAVYSGGFPENKGGVLVGGPGKIIGTALANGKPVEGLKLRLGLNGSVMSQWATTDSKGIYRIDVPFGKYKIYGYELDINSANHVLPNKIDLPFLPFSSNSFDVTQEDSGHGINFKFVDPIIKTLHKHRFSFDDNVVLAWSPYPEAVNYIVQIIEKDEPNTWKGKNMFNWSDRPSVTEAKLNISTYGVKLKPGHFYSYNVEARDKTGQVISTTVENFREYDFETVE